MAGHLCLKWNNHCSSFLNSISKIHLQDKYCDATIVCQGNYFPVHRIILATCSEYFEEMFERIQCQHPYIVFKDIDPKEMELLLNYMYQGEVNVIQESLPSLIKAAESLRIKGLAVPDDLPPSKESSSRKRSSSSSDNPHSKRRMDESKRKKDSSDNSQKDSHEADEYPNSDSASNTSDKGMGFLSQEITVDDSVKVIKEEPEESSSFNQEALQSDFGGSESSHPQLSSDHAPQVDQPNFNFPTPGESSYVKIEGEASIEESFDQLSSAAWSDVSSETLSQPLPPNSVAGQDDISCGTNSMGRKSTLNYREQEENRDLGQSHDASKSVQNSKSVHQCTMCDFVTAQKGNLMVHVRYKHTGERPYPCTLCPKRFVDKHYLMRHFFIHTGEKPFPCSFCPMRFNQKGNLKRHIAFKHLQ